MKDIFSLKGKVAIVTGGARGNGKAIVRGFLDKGAIVYTIDLISRKPLDEKETVMTGDITAKRNTQGLIDRVVKERARVDILVNNAGVTMPGSSEKYSIENWIKTLEINLTAHFKLSQLAAAAMIEKKTGGSIINITSLSAELGFPGNPAYVSAKGGLKMLTKALAADWARYNIRVNNICPGYIHTSMTDKSFNDPKLHKKRLERIMIPRWGEPEDLVGAAIFLASDASLYITGIDLPVDGGWLAKGL